MHSLEQAEAVYTPEFRKHLADEGYGSPLLGRKSPRNSSPVGHLPLSGLAVLNATARAAEPSLYDSPDSRPDSSFFDDEFSSALNELPTQTTPEVLEYHADFPFCCSMRGQSSGSLRQSMCEQCLLHAEIVERVQEAGLNDAEAYIIVEADRIARLRERILLLECIPPAAPMADAFKEGPSVLDKCLSVSEKCFNRALCGRTEDNLKDVEKNYYFGKQDNQEDLLTPKRSVKKAKARNCRIGDTIIEEATVDDEWVSISIAGIIRSPEPQRRRSFRPDSGLFFGGRMFLGIAHNQASAQTICIRGVHGWQRPIMLKK